MLETRAGETSIPGVSTPSCLAPEELAFRLPIITHAGKADEARRIGLLVTSPDTSTRLAVMRAADDFKRRGLQKATPGEILRAISEHLAAVDAAVHGGE